MSRPDFTLESVKGRNMMLTKAAALGLDFNVLEDVLALRVAHERGGNRRRLFAAFDAMFDGQEQPGGAISPRCVDAGGSIRLVKLSFKNWKVFSEIVFDFPDFDPAKPVCLIGGKNGYGKTSLLEGLMYGLFGRTAVLEMNKGSHDASTIGGRNAAYRQMLERALHRPALENGENVIVVQSEWETPEGALIVDRRWYFDNDGRLNEDDESLTLRIGTDKSYLAVPEGADASAFYQTEVNLRLMSPSIASFVLFDGEQVKRFSERDFSEQMRLVVESVLGIASWRDAIADLRDYARDRTRGFIRSDKGFETATAEIAHLANEEARIESALEKLEAQKSGPREKRDTLLATIGRLESNSYESSHALLEKRQANAGAIVRSRQEFSVAASTELPFILVGKSLRRRVVEKLEMLAAAQLSPTFGDVNALSALLDAISQQPPKLSPTKKLEIQKRVTAAWTSLLVAKASPAAEGSFAYLPVSQRSKVIERLATVNQAPELVAAGIQVRSTQQLAVELADAIASEQSRVNSIQDGRHALDALSSELRRLDDESGALNRELGTVQGQLRLKRDEVNAKFGSQKADDIFTARSESALRLSALIDALIESVKPLCFEEVGHVVTGAYRALAHKDLVKKVAIAADGGVRMLDERGQDVRAFDASAGEGQVFAMALMAAVGELATRSLPAIMDTPLGRLDPDHRVRVLEYFTSRKLQTVILSQPDEVSGKYLKMIEGRVSASFHLQHAPSSHGPGTSLLRSGYFAELAA